MDSQYKPYIVSAAVRFPHKGELLIVTSPRHFDKVCSHTLEALGHGVDEKIEYEQGFVDQRGRYYTREEAYLIAKENGQIRRNIITSDTGVLYSEMLY